MGGEKFPPYKLMKKYLYLVIFAIFFVPLSVVFPSIKINVGWYHSLVSMFRGTDVWYMQYIALLFILFFGVCMHLWRFNKYLSIFLFLALTSTIITAGQAPRALLCLLRLTLCMVAMFAISKFRSKDFKAIFKSFLVMASLQVFLIVLQSFNLDPLFDSLADRSVDDQVGFSGSKNQI